MKKIILLILLGLTISSYAFDLPNYINDKRAKSRFNKKDYNGADSVFSLINNEKNQYIVLYNRALVQLAKNNFQGAIERFERVLKSKKINGEQLLFNMNKAYADSGLKAMGTGDKEGSSIIMVKKAIKGFDKLYKNSKDSIITHNSLQELYKLTRLLNKQQKSKKKQKNKNSKNKNKKKNKKNKKKDNKNGKNQKQQQNKDKNKSGEKKKKNIDQKMYKMLLDNVKENKKKMMKKEIKAMNKNQKEAW